MSDTLKNLLQTGVKFHQLGKLELASQIYTTILRVQPENSDANYNLGLLAVRANKLEKALPFLETALENNADNVFHWISYIDALLETGQMEVAKAVFDQAKINGAEGEGFDKLEKKLKDTQGKQVEASSTNLEAKQQMPNILDSISLNQAIKLAKDKVQESNPEEASLSIRIFCTNFPRIRGLMMGLRI